MAPQTCGLTSAPLSPHSSPNVIAKYNERKLLNQSLLLFGDGIDAEISAKSQLHLGNHQGLADG
ncbi:hypothetical protein DFJ58DRAFT_764300 [Suillus subalutaceus]|uniref:uncharacterized protein n=1 Tax=Suillus subalutaceus TaxID=48586 RepID=UPI001B8624D9|nr:uncharacterized protein DFJ58DRAFT_764300 [Suillus subalutaceus]KAG1870721.1 hypothetical protein DFJ58DRAFT_764300 [Suillus subalutaceus]